MTDKDVLKERRKYIASLLCITQDSINVKEVATQWGVSEQAIYKDLRSETVTEFVIDEVKNQMRGEGVAKAWDNVKRAILRGDVKTSRWLLENLKVFEGGTTDKFDEFLHWLNEPEPQNETTADCFTPGNNGHDPGED